MITTPTFAKELQLLSEGFIDRSPAGYPRDVAEKMAAERCKFRVDRLTAARAALKAALDRKSESAATDTLAQDGPPLATNPPIHQSNQSDSVQASPTEKDDPLPEVARVSLTSTMKPRKSNDTVPPVLDNFYAQWRAQRGVVPLLREDTDSPPERLLQAVWQHQRLLRDQLQTLEGQPVRVLHPGFHNVEGGPDFRGAVIQIGDAPPKTGDVEVDLRPSGWRAHGHDRNPNFQNVILQVIWEGSGKNAFHRVPDSSPKSSPPALPLRGALDTPLGELSLWLGSEAAQSLPEQLRGRCCAPLRELQPPQLVELLHQAALVRLQSKAAQFHARARQAGWDQALWEGLFRALGYKHNVWPMQRLAELRPRWATDSAKPLVLQARLLGLSGLLPAELTRSQSGADNYLRRVWDQWWRERDEFSDCVLPRALWRFHGLRPANHPQRRLALASRWPVDGELASKLERWSARELPEKALPGSLLETLQVESDEFWSWHFTLRSARLQKSQPLLGSSRVTDLAVNVVLPWLWGRAKEDEDGAARRAIEQRYFAWPPAEDNALLRLARQRLLSGASRRALPGAAAQQGLVQIVRDFCEHSNSLCENCKLPDLVREWNAWAQRGIHSAALHEGSEEPMRKMPVAAGALKRNEFRAPPR